MMHDNDHFRSNLTKADLKEMAEWAAELYAQRTREVAAGTASLYVVSPAYRVTTHEVIAQFKIKLAPWMADFQREFKNAMRKRKLLKVLSGKMKSDEWVKLYPTDN